MIQCSIVMTCKGTYRRRDGLIPPDYLLVVGKAAVISTTRKNQPEDVMTIEAVMQHGTLV